MPTYTITLGDQEFEVEVPEGVDPNEALQQAIGDATGVTDEDGAAESLGALLTEVDPETGRKRAVSRPGEFRLGKAFAAGVVNPVADLLNLAGDVGAKALGIPEEFPRLRFKRPIEFEAETLGESFAQGAGEVLPIAVGGGATLAAKAPALAARAEAAAGPISRFLPRAGQVIGETFKKSPVAATLTELVGGGGARVGAELAEEAGAGTGGQIAAGVGGGVATVLAPSAAVNVARRGGAAVIERLLPMTPEGAAIRAAKQTQARAGTEPAVLAKRIDEAPEGVSPARATEDPTLLAQERTILDKDPVLAQQVADDLESAQFRTMDELAESFGPGSNPGDWQNSVVQSVAPKGVTVAKGSTAKMMQDVFESFEGAYQVAKGHPIRLGTDLTPGASLSDILAQSAFRKDIIATPGEREAVLNFLVDLAGEVEKRVALSARKTAEGIVTRPRGTVLSDTLLAARQRIRTKLRAKAKAGQTGDRAAVEAEILRDAERRITGVLEDQLPQAAKRALRATDKQYRDFKTVQNASQRGFGEFNAQQLQAAIRQRSPVSLVAQGQAGQLQQMALRGQELTKVLGRPREAARLITDATPDQIASIKGDFTKLMMSKTLGRTTDGVPITSGKNLTKFLSDQRATMKALGFTPDDLARADTIARQFVVMQKQSPAALRELLEDGPGMILRFLTAVQGSMLATRAARKLGMKGAGPSLIVAKFGSEVLRKRLNSITQDHAGLMLSDAVTNRELFKAILTRSTDPLKRQATATKTINAYLVSIGVDALEDE